MNSKWHLYTSFIKSGMRIFGAASSLITGRWEDVAFSFLSAEIVGVLEEIGDRR